MSKKMFLVFSQFGKLQPRLFKKERFAKQLMQKNQQYKIKQFDDEIIASNTILIYEVQHEKFKINKKKNELEQKLKRFDSLNESSQTKNQNHPNLSSQSKTQQKPNLDTINEKKYEKTSSESPNAKLQSAKHSLYRLNLNMQKLLQSYTPTLASKPISPLIHYTGFFDGCSKFNPGPAGVGYYIMDREDIILQACWPLGNKTNNQAEFSALLYLLVDAYVNKIKNINIYGDSKLIIEIASGKMRASHPNMVDYAQVVKKLLNLFNHTKLQFIQRKYNTRADKLSNEALKKKFDASEKITDKVL